MPFNLTRRDAVPTFPRPHVPDQALPAPGVRWTPARKAQLIAAIEQERITLEEACRRYALSVEEFQAWARARDAHGVPGLRTTRVQIYRMTAGR